MQTAAAERMRRMRARRKAEQDAPILYEREDWKLFIDPQTLTQKAGCEPNQIGRVVIKELVDNALDIGADVVTLDGDTRRCTVSDNGPGLDPKVMLQVFAVNRPLLSSKLKRLPTRGMLGNGLRVVMGAVAALRGTITVTTRGAVYELGSDPVTAKTRVISSGATPERPGLTVTVAFPADMFRPDDYAAGEETIRLAPLGQLYHGPSQPGWYDAEALRDLLAAAPKGTPLAAVIKDAFGIAGTEPEIDTAWATAFIAEHADKARRGNGGIGEIGAEAFERCFYRKVAASARIGGEAAQVPFTVE